MASRRDVELIIEARDKASQALRNIKDALKELEAIQKDVADGAKGVGGSLAQLEATLKRLRGAFKGGGPEAIAKELEAARDAYARLSDAVRRAYADLGALQSRHQKAIDAAERAADAERKAADAARAATEERRKAAAAVAELERKQRQLNRELTRQRTRRDTVRGQLTGARAELKSREAALARLRKQIGDVDKATAAQRRSLEAAERAAERARQKFEQLNGAYEKARQGVKDIQARLEELNAALREARRELRAKESALKQAEREYKTLAAEARKAGQSVDKFAKELTAAKQRVREAEADLRKAKGAVQELQQTWENSKRAIRAAAQALADAAKPIADKQRRAMLEAKRAWKETEQAIAGLARRMRSMKQPTAEMRAEMERLKQQALQQKETYATWREAIHRTNQALRGEVTTLAQVEQRLAAIRQAHQAAAAQVQRLAQAERALAGAAGRSAAEIARSLGVTQRQAAVLLRLRDSGRSLAQAFNQVSVSTGRFRRALRAAGVDARKALSFTQRLRGQVLSLIAAYGGFFGALRGLQSIQEAQMTLDRAVNRMMSVTDGNVSRVRQELEFIRRAADELGIEFGALAQEYTKFALSTKGTNLEGEKTRFIFRSVAQAARVAGLSTEQVKRTFVALSQIAAKGVVQMEELRQQLGDAIPGAVKIMARAAGYGEGNIKAFYKAVEQGEISADALVGFAAELNRIYGGQLPQALNTTAAALGRLQNQFFQARLTVAQAGAERGLIDFYRTLTEVLKSPDAQQALKSLGQAIQGLLNLLGELVRRWKLMANVFTFFFTAAIGKRAVVFFRALISQMGATGTAASRTRRIVAATAATMAGTSGLAGKAMVAGRGIRALAVAMRALNPVALAVSVVLPTIVTYLLNVSTSADRASEALSRHRELMDKVRLAYDKAQGDLRRWTKGIREISKVRLEDNLARMRRSVRELAQELKDSAKVSFGDFLGSLFDPQQASRMELAAKARRQLQPLLAAFADGRITAEEFRKKLDEMSDTLARLDEAFPGLRQRVIEAADAYIKQKGAVQEAEEALRAHERGATKATERILKLKDEQQGLEEAYKRSGKAIRDFGNALKGLGIDLGNATSEIDKQVSALDKLKAAYEEAMKSALGMEERLAAMKAYEGAKVIIEESQKLESLPAEERQRMVTMLARAMEEARKSGKPVVDALNRMLQEQQATTKAVQEQKASIDAAAQKTSATFQDTNRGVTVELAKQTALMETGSTDLRRGSAQVVREGTFGGRSLYSYGFLGLNRQMLRQFLKESPEIARMFTAGFDTPAFRAQWKQLAQQHADLFVQAQLQFYERRIVRPARGMLNRVGASRFANDPRAISFAADARVQYGGLADKYFRVAAKTAKSTEDYLQQVATLMKANLRSDFRTFLRNHPNALGGLRARVDRRLTQALSLKGKPFYGAQKTLKEMDRQATDTLAKAKAIVRVFGEEAKKRAKTLRQREADMATRLRERQEVAQVKQRYATQPDKLKEELAVLREQQRLRRIGLQLTKEQEAAIRRTVRMEIQAQRQGRPDSVKMRELSDAARQAAQEAQAAEQRLNLLIKQRAQLLEQLKQARLEGQPDEAAGLEQRIQVLNQEIELQRQKAMQLEIEAARKREIAEAARAGREVDQQELTQRQQLIQMKYQELSAQNQLNLAKQQAAMMEERISLLQQQRQALIAQYKMAQQQGDTQAMQSLAMQIQQVNQQLLQAINLAIQFHQNIGGAQAQASIAKLQQLKMEIQTFNLQQQQTMGTMRNFASMMANSFTNAIGQAIQAMIQGKSVGRALQQVFAQLLIQLGQMLLRMAFMRMFQGLFGGFGLLGGLFGFGHTGGIVGARFISGNPPRRVNPMVFIGARRFHDGGLPGLMPNEVPAILKKGEEVLTQDDPRHINNIGQQGGQGAGKPQVNVKVVNTIDPGEFVSEGLDTPQGEQAILNWMRANRDAVKGALE